MMQPKGKHERPQNTSSVKQLSKIASTVHMLYHLSGELLYLRYRPDMSTSLESLVASRKSFLLESQVKSRVLFITSCVGSRIIYDNANNVPQGFTTVSRATEVVIYLTGLNNIILMYPQQNMHVTTTHPGVKKKKKNRVKL